MVSGDIVIIPQRPSMLPRRLDLRVLFDTSPTVVSLMDSSIRSWTKIEISRLI